MQDQSSGSFVRDDLDSQGEMLLARMIAGSAEHSTRPVRLEFYLPTALFDHRVEQWRIGPPDQAVCIGLEIPTVVRSLDRLTTATSRDHWYRRWDKRNAHDPSFWIHQRADNHGDVQWGPDHIALDSYADVNDLYRHLNAVMADLSCAQACCLASRSESRRHPIDGLGVSVRAGIPIALWCRAKVPHEELATAFADLIAVQSADDLPGRVHELRLTGMADWHNDVVILYDDPNRVVLPSSSIEPFNQLRGANV